MARRGANGVIYSGPFFEGDPKKRIGQNIRDLTEFYSGQTADMMRAQFTSGKGMGHELAPTVAELRITLNGRTYGGRVYSTMSVTDRPRSWVSWLETGRRRSGGVNSSTATRFKGLRQWRKVTAAIKKQVKVEVVRLKVMKGVI